MPATSAYARAWTTAQLREGRGRGYCPRRSGRCARISTERRGHVQNGGGCSASARPLRVRAFALDEIEPWRSSVDGAPCIASIRKLRLDSERRRIDLDDVSPRARRHAYVPRTAAAAAPTTSSRSPTPSSLSYRSPGAATAASSTRSKRGRRASACCASTAAARAASCRSRYECERETRTLLEIVRPFAGTSTGAIVAFGLATELPVAALLAIV